MMTLWFLTGIILRRVIFGHADDGLPMLLSGILMLLLLLLFLCRGRRVFIYFLSLFFLFIGIQRAGTRSSEGAGLGDVSGIIGRETLFYGEVASDPETKDTVGGNKRTNFEVKIHDAMCDDQVRHVRLKALCVMTRPEMVVEFGDVVFIRGTLRDRSGKVLEERDGRFIEKQGTHRFIVSCGRKGVVVAGRSNGPRVFLQRRLFRFRKKCQSIICRALGAGTSGLACSMLIGQKSAMAGPVKKALRGTGTLHIAVVSGLHTALVGAIFLFVAKVLRLTDNKAFLISSIMVAMFVVMTGAGVPAVRAFVMWIMVGGAKVFGKKTSLMGPLIVSAFAITFIDPMQLLSAGFLLSYAATIGILTLKPFIKGTPVVFVHSVGRRVIRFVWESIMVSLSVFLAISPVTAFFFHTITPVMLLANVLAIPVLIAVLGLGMLLLACGQVPFLFKPAMAAGYIMHVILERYIDIAAGMSCVPGGVFQVPRPSILLITIFYAGLVSGVYIFRTRSLRCRIALVTLLFLNFVLWNGALPAYAGNSSVAFLDAGKADSAVMRFRDGGILLVDGGRSGDGTRESFGKTAICPYLREKRVPLVDCIVLSHPHDDHVGGLIDVVRELKVRLVVHNKAEMWPKDLYAGHGFLEVLEDLGIRHESVLAGEEIRGFRGARIKILNPMGDEPSGNVNDDSVVVKIEDNSGLDVLFCGDISDGIIEDIMGSGMDLSCDILKYPHHGRGIKNAELAENFIKMTGCKDVVITAPGPEHISPYIISICEKHGVGVHITGEYGNITFESN